MPQSGVWLSITAMMWRLKSLTTIRIFFRWAKEDTCRCEDEVKSFMKIKEYNEHINFRGCSLIRSIWNGNNNNNDDDKTVTEHLDVLPQVSTLLYEVRTVIILILHRNKRRNSESKRLAPGLPPDTTLELIEFFCKAFSSPP